MADNVGISTGTDATVAADDIGGALYQRVKISVGADGAADDLAPGQALMAASVPVVIASNQTAVPVSAAALPLPSGAATSALQGGGLPAALGAGGGLKVDGSGTALPVSGTVAVTNSDLSTLAGAVSGTHMQVDVLSGASGATAVSVDVTLSMTAEAHHAGDVLAATQEVASVARANGTGVELVSMVVRDADDQTAAATTFYFLDANSALGTEGSAPDIDDTEVQDICGIVVVPAAAWIDLGTSKIANMQNIGLLMHPAADSTSLFIAATTAGTPTPSATGMTVTLQFIRY